MAIEWNGKAPGAGWFKRGAVAAAVVMLAACGDSETYKMQKQLEAALAQAQAAQAAAAAAQAQAAQAAQAAANQEATKAAEAATKEDEAATAVADELVEQGFTVSVVAGYANCETVTSGTSVAIAVVGAPGRYFFAIKPVAPIKASKCVNPVTNSGLPDLERQAPSVSDTEAAITPVTTLIVNNVPLANIRAFFDIPDDVTDADLLGDPIVLAETKPKVLQASVKASAVVEAAVSGGTQTAQEAKNNLTNELSKQQVPTLAQVAASVGAQPEVLQAAADVAAQVATILANASGAEAKREAVKQLESVLTITKAAATEVAGGGNVNTAVAQVNVQKAAQEAASNTAISNATQIFTTEETKTAAKVTIKAEVKKALANETTNAVSQADLDRAAQANAEAAAALAAANAARQAAAAAAAAAALAAQEAAAAEAARLAAQQALQQAQQNLANAGGTGGGS
jgi:hypothetical protein